MEQVMNLLKELATSLGIAVEYLWATLVKQQIAEGVTNIVIAVLGIILVIILAIYTPMITKIVSTKYKERRASRERGEGTGFCGSRYISSGTEDAFYVMRIAIPVGAVIIALVVFGLTIDNITDGIQQLINPDYFALKEILDVLKINPA